MNNSATDINSVGSYFQIDRCMTKNVTFIVIQKYIQDVNENGRGSLQPLPRHRAKSIDFPLRFTFDLYFEYQMKETYL